MTLQEAREKATLVIDEYDESCKQREWNGNARGKWFVDNLRIGQFGLHRAPGGFSLWKRVDARRNDGTALVCEARTGSW